MFEHEVFRKHIYCIEKSTCDIVGTFRHHRSDSAPGELCPRCPSLYAPALVAGLLIRPEESHKQIVLCAEDHAGFVVNAAMVASQ